MISVPSLRQPSSGNKGILFWILGIFIALGVGACGTSKKAQRSQRPDIQVTPEKNPVEDAEVRFPERIDTVIWTEIPDEESRPVRSLINDLKFRSRKKEVYNIALLAPFRADNIAKGIKLNQGYKRFLDYYLGMKLAAGLLEKEGISLNIKTYDTEFNDQVTSRILSDPYLSTCDVIIGPYKRSNVKKTLQFALENQITSISPWISSNTLTRDNPYYLQLKPSLTRHYTEIRNHILKNELQPYTIFVAREEDKNKWDNLKDIFNPDIESTENSTFFTDTLWIKEDSLGPEKTVFVDLLREKENPVFFIPYPSAQDENFVYTLLRKLNIDKAEKEVIVYGPGTWIEYKDAVLDLFNTLDIRLSIANLFISESEKYAELKQDYYNNFGSVLSSDAAEGIDMMLFIGRSLQQSGNYFHVFPSESPIEMGQTVYEIEPVYNVSKERGARIQFYENFYIQMMEYIDFQFVKIP